MLIRISTSNGTPIYRQIISQVQYLVASGRLKAGDTMPPIRALAQQLLINPNTVARAYRDLETMGVLESKQGSGTVVSAAGSPLAQDTKEKIIRERVVALLAEGQQLGYLSNDIFRILFEESANMEEEGD